MQFSMPYMKKNAMSIKTHIEKNKCLKSLSTFGVGGKARYFIAVHTIKEMQQIAWFVQKEQIPYWVVGKGSNTLFDDRGFNGLIILNKIEFMQLNGGTVNVGAGYPFSLLGKKTAKQGWSGVEFAACIPGSVGGAIYMNAGANDCTTRDALHSVTYVDMMGIIIQKQVEELLFSYRSSCFQKMEGFIVSGQFTLKRDRQTAQRQLEMIIHRTNTQPCGEKSAGCVFRNPGDLSAGFLIEQCNLKGVQIGGAKVSTKHGNFIVNTGKATAKDILNLIMLLQSIIKEKTGQILKTEISLVPYEPIPLLKKK